MDRVSSPIKHKSLVKKRSSHSNVNLNIKRTQLKLMELTEQADDNDGEDGLVRRNEDVELLVT